MNVDQDLVNAWVEPSLFPSGGLAVTLECLVDRSEGTVLFVVTSRDVSAGKLRALWSSAPQPIEDFSTAAQRASLEYDAQVREVTGPFP